MGLRQPGLPTPFCRALGAWKQLRLFHLKPLLGTRTGVRQFLGSRWEAVAFLPCLRGASHVLTHPGHLPGSLPQSRSITECPDGLPFPVLLLGCTLGILRELCREQVTRGRTKASSGHSGEASLLGNQGGGPRDSTGLLSLWCFGSLVCLLWRLRLVCAV